jgi:hypothetical protein
MPFTEDYAQSISWASSLKTFPCFRRCLRFFAQPTQINLNGLTHRGKKKYNLECVGFIYILLWLVLLSVSEKILEPLANNEIYKTATDEITPINETFLYPTIKSFDQEAQLVIQIFSLSNVKCGDIQGILNTKAEAIILDCDKTDSSNSINFRLPLPEDHDFRYENYTMWIAGKSHDVHDFIDIQCVSDFNLCNFEIPFMVRLFFNTLKGSEHGGLVSVKQETHEFMQTGEIFHMTLRARVIRLIETNRHGN